jgi:hypothetical protein
LRAQDPMNPENPDYVEKIAPQPSIKSYIAITVCPTPTITHHSSYCFLPFIHQATPPLHCIKDVVFS